MSDELVTTIADHLRDDARTLDFQALCVRLLETVRSQPDTAVDRRWHPLGFAVISWTVGPLTQLRLHIWPDILHEEQVNDHRHDHRWDLCSYIVCGSLIEHELELREARPGDDRSEILQVVQIEQERGIDSSYVTTRQVVVDKDIAKPQLSGDTYRLPAGQFHWTEPSRDRPVATLVRSEVVLDRGPLTLLPLGATPMPPVTRDTLAAEELAELLDQVLAES